MLAHLVFGEDPPAGCGSSNAELLDVGGGASADRPCGWKPWCSEANTKVWYAQAQHVFSLVRTAWNSLVTAENALEGPLDPAERHKGSRALHDYVLAYENAYEKLAPAPWWQAAGAEGVVFEMVNNVKMGACALEQLNAALANVGATPIYAPDSPDAPPLIPTEPISQISMAVVFVAIAALAFFALGGRR